MVTTFLPFHDIKKTAKCLDYKRLGKQRLEAKQLINILEYLDSCEYKEEAEDFLILDSKKRKIVFFKDENPFTDKVIYDKDKPRKIPWINHPALKMWIGHTEALKEYYNIILQEWIDRGYNNTMTPYIVINPIYPWWFGRHEVHISHQIVLLRKDFAHYSRYFDNQNIDLEIDGYIWYDATIVKPVSISYNIQLEETEEVLRKIY